MRMSSAVLDQPILLGGKATRELPGDALELDLIANYDRHVLEIHQRGKLIAVRPFSSVVEMRPAPKGEQCPDCPLAFEDARGLAGHRLHKHGVKGSGIVRGR